MPIKKCICKKISYFCLVFSLYSSICFAIGEVPISNMGCYDLIKTTNTILSLGKQNIYCSELKFRKMAENQKLFYCYVDKQNIYHPANGLVMLYENLSGEATVFGISFEINDKVKFLQSAAVFSSLMLACGLTPDEAEQLIKSLIPINNTKQYGRIWSHRLNRYYYLAGEKEGDDICTFVLFAKDSV